MKQASVMLVKIFITCDSACWNPDSMVILHALQAQRARVCDRDNISTLRNDLFANLPTGAASFATCTPAVPRGRIICQKVGYVGRTVIMSDV